MGRETYKADADLTEDDRFRINSARAVLREFGRNPQPDMPEPLSELGYEQRMARARALELSVASHTGDITDMVVTTAHRFYRFIWTGETDAEV